MAFHEFADPIETKPIRRRRGSRHPPDRGRTRWRHCRGPPAAGSRARRPPAGSSRRLASQQRERRAVVWKLDLRARPSTRGRPPFPRMSTSVSCPYKSPSSTPATRRPAAGVPAPDAPPCVSCRPPTQCRDCRQRFGHRRHRQRNTGLEHQTNRRPLPRTESRHDPRDRDSQPDEAPAERVEPPFERRAFNVDISLTSAPIRPTSVATPVAITTPRPSPAATVVPL